VHKRVAALLSRLIELEDVDTWEAWAAAFTYNPPEKSDRDSFANQFDVADTDDRRNLMATELGFHYAIWNRKVLSISEIRERIFTAHREAVGAEEGADASERDE
jgi:hypothetical protein